MGSYQVPQVPIVLPNMFSTAPHFYPICDHPQEEWAKFGKGSASKVKILLCSPDLQELIV
jgi:hypothetical protein